MSTTADQAGKALLGRFLSRLRFPQLFAFTAGLLALDLLVPDLIPFVDEILLAATTYLLANWKKPVETAPPEPAAKPPMKDITPTDDSPGP